MASPCGALMLVAILGLISGCPKVEDLRFETNANAQELAKLRGKPVVILALHTANERMNTQNHYYATGPVIDAQRKGLTDAFGKYFDVRDLSVEKLLRDPEVALRNVNTISEIVKRAGVEGALIAISSYGFMKDAPNTQVLEYDFASDIYLVQREGLTIWNFYGKSVAYRKPFSGGVTGVLKGALGGATPSEQAMLTVVKHYMPCHMSDG